MVTILQKKIFRDAKETRWSFIAIICICTLGIALFSGINLYVSTISSKISENYQEFHLADYWVYKSEVTPSDVKAVQTLDYVENVQRRKVFDMSLQQNANVSIHVHAIEGKALINIPELVEGNTLEETDTTVLLLDSRLAEAYQLSVGDSLLLSDGTASTSWLIKGIVKNAEYLYYAPEGLTIPDYNRYGFAYTNASAVPDIAFNELILTTSENEDIKQEQIMNDIRQEIGVTNIISRRHQPSYRKIADTMVGIQQVGLLFSIAFFLVAAFITWITIDRLMENQRQNLGMLLALGYSKSEIIMRYSIYGLIISMPSMVLSWFISRYFIANMLYELGTTYYTIDKDGVDYFSFHFFLASLCIIIITCGAIFFSCRKTLNTTSAKLLRPKPPKQGHQILLERMAFLWRNLSFSEKIIFRNLFRNKVQLTMGLFGIIGSSALILCGFGLINSIGRMLDNTFDDTIKYDAEIKFRKPITEQEAIDIYGTLGNVKVIDATMALSVYLYGNNQNTGNPYLVVMDKYQKSLNFNDLKHNKVKLPDEGVFITNRLANNLSVNIGDTLKAERLDGTVIPLKVASIIDFPIGNEIYMSKESFSKVSSIPFSIRTMLIQGKDLNFGNLRNNPRISLIESKNEIRENMLFIMRSLHSFQYILISFAALLAFAIMMVLGRMNYTERIRELATLKVLGFHQKEIKRLVLSENIWITIMGLPFGFLFGYNLLVLILMQATTPELEISPYISFVSLAVVTCLIFTFVLFVNYLMGRKFKTINMVSSLKSIE